MSNQLLVKNSTLIQAPPATVWDVLVHPYYIKQWDDVPEGYPDLEPLSLGAELVWKHPNGESTALKVITLEPHKKLFLSLSVSNWSYKPAPESVGYTYSLSEQEDGTGLSITIGDFALIPNGESYYQAALEFATAATRKIKELAEKRG